MITQPSPSDPLQNANVCAFCGRPTDTYLLTYYTPQFLNKVRRERPRCLIAPHSDFIHKACLQSLKFRERLSE